MAIKQNYKVISISDILDYVNCDERKNVLNSFIMRNCCYFENNLKTYTEKFKLLAYIDSLIKFPKEEDMSQMYWREFFPFRDDILDGYIILNKDAQVFLNELKGIPSKLVLKPIETLDVSADIKCVYSVFYDTQMQHYYKEHNWLTLAKNSLDMNGGIIPEDKALQVYNDITDLLSKMNKKDKDYER